MKFLSKETLSAFFAKIAEKETLYLPQKQENGKAAYKEWREGAEYARNLNTVRSAKDFFFPQTENLMDFKMEGKNITIEDTRKECEDFVLFGVRACDARSFDILDSVYLANPVDTYYQNRRSHGTVITVACTRPGESCFCHVFGIDATDPAGDVTAWETGEGFFFRANTEKGEALLAAAGDLLSEKDAAAVEEQRAAVKAVQAKMPLATLTAEGFGGGLTKELFDRPEWKTLSEACLGCGSCTFHCPTCQCYDIRDFDTGHGIKRFRCWDSCMYSDFTKMSAGQPRPTQLERFRQRFMHKLVYYPENNGGVFGCVGCGRCLIGCPISMNIVKVMKTLGGKSHE